MPKPADLSLSFEACRVMTRHHAKTFYFASHVLPSAKRRDAYAVYAFCRYVDDQIDLAPNEASRRRAYGMLHEILDAAYSEPNPEATEYLRELPWLAAFRDTAGRRQIPRAYFLDLLTGVEMDRGQVRVRNWEELDLYCYHVAAVVGLIMVHVLTEPSEELLVPARHLGTAMQLTNILRDVREDWERDRLYLPLTELDHYHLTPDDVAAYRVDDSFRELMRFQIDRARSFYAAAEPGILGLPDDGSRFCVRLMSTVYGGILDEIERAKYNVYRGRVRVSFPRKLTLALKSWKK